MSGERERFATPEKLRVEGKKKQTPFTTTPIFKNRGDRFIPQRFTPLREPIISSSVKSFTELDLSSCSQQEQNDLLYRDMLERKMLESIDCSISRNSEGVLSAKCMEFGPRKENADIRVTAFPLKSDAPEPSESKLTRSIAQSRRVPRLPFKTLEAGGVLDDFYTEILDWSATDQSAIALARNVFVYDNGRADGAARLASLPDCAPSAVKFSPSGTHLAVADDFGRLEVFDLQKNVPIFSLKPHKKRVVSLSWMNDGILSSGSRDCSIKTLDLRTAQPASSRAKKGHEVCGLKWNPSQGYLASGGNDNLVLVWDSRLDFPVHTFDEHKSAVRALAWWPHNSSLLLTGGGTVDKTIKFWNLQASASTHTLATDSQICSILFSKRSNEFVTSHGFYSNRLEVWSASQKERIAAIDAHQNRVLHLAQGPDPESVISLSADGFLKFWKVFPDSEEEKENKPANAFNSLLASIR